MTDANEDQQDAKRDAPAPETQGLGHGLFPEAWVKRIPLLAAVSAGILGLAAIGHTLGGLGELAHFFGAGSAPTEHAAEQAAGDAKLAEAPAQLPVSFALNKDATRPLDGYQLTGTGTLPADVKAGPVLPGGAKTRLVLQASNADQVVQVDRVALVVTKIAQPEIVAFNYDVDPLKQSGFGAAQPRQFYVRLNDGAAADVFYIRDGNVNEPSSAENILPATLPILVLDRQAGLQETLDLNIVASEHGLYQVMFKAHATSGGKEYDLEAGPIYIVRK